MKIIVSLLLVFFYSTASWANVTFNDVSRLNPTSVGKIIQVRDIQDILQALKETRSKGLKISIAGKRHSQGGQQSYPNGIVLDMLDFNKIISLDVKNKII